MKWMLAGALVLGWWRGVAVAAGADRGEDRRDVGGAVHRAGHLPVRRPRRLTVSCASPANPRDDLAVLAAILADLEPQSFTSARNAEATAELLGLDPKVLLLANTAFVGPRCRVACRGCAGGRGAAILSSHTAGGDPMAEIRKELRTLKWMLAGALVLGWPSGVVSLWLLVRIAAKIGAL